MSNAERQEQERLAKANAELLEQERLALSTTRALSNPNATNAVVNSNHGKIPPVVSIFGDQKGLFNRPVNVAVSKLERLIQIPGNPREGFSEQRIQLQQLPPTKNFVVDVDRVVNMQKAIRLLDSQIALNASNASSYFERGNLNYRISNFPKAADDYTKSIELEPANPAAWINRGALRRKSGDLIGAISDYEQAIKLSPNDPDAYRNLGIAKEQVGDTVGALKDWNKAGLLGDKEATEWVAIAAPQIRDIAIETISHIHSPNDTKAPQDNATLSLKMPVNFTKPITKIQLALASKPSDPQLLYQRGTEFLKNGQPSQAIIDFSAVLKVYPQSVRAIFNRAVAKRQIGDLNGALLDYNIAIQLSPKDNQTYRNRGIVKQMLGNQIGACADWGIASGLGDREASEWIQNECR